MTVTMEDGMRKKIRGHLCHDEYEAGDIELSRLIRETLARPYPLWLFNGRLEEGRGRYVFRVETKDGGNGHRKKAVSGKRSFQSALQPEHHQRPHRTPPGRSVGRIEEWYEGWKAKRLSKESLFAWGRGER